MDHSIKLASTSSGSSVDPAGAGLTPRRGSNSSSDVVPGSAPGNNSASGSHSAIKCPRCDSLNTKFCYFNNYSHAQPRHFCKSCRRYWTAGGALRNVPVGGGCRKNKRVKQRPLLNIGTATHGLLVDPSSFNLDDTTSNMLARLSSSTSPFPNFNGGSSGFNGGTEDTSTQLLNIAFSRFQESMRLRHPLDHQGSEIPPYLDMGFPSLVHKQSAPFNTCLCGTCGSRTNSLHGGCEGLIDSFEGFGTLPRKLEQHDAGLVTGGFCTGGTYELNSLYHDASSNGHMLGTSATATLASIEDQLSSFSNLQHVNAFNTDTSSGGSMEGTERNMASGPLQLVGHVNNAEDTIVESAFMDETKERLNMQHDMDEKPLLSNVSTNHELSLMMHIDSSWQQPSLLMNEMLMESQPSNFWNTHPTTSRWQDNMHPMAAGTPATAARGML